MRFEQVIDAIKEVIDAYDGTLSFEYGRVWDMNAKPSRIYPCFLVECQPNFSFGGVQHNYRMGKQQFKGKLFIYDTYWQDQRATDSLWKKQSDLNELFLQLLAEIKGRLLLNYKLDVNFGEGFFGWFESHNSKLVEVYVPFDFWITECTLAEFNYD